MLTILIGSGAATTVKPRATMSGALVNDALTEWLEDLEDIAAAERVLVENSLAAPAEEVWKRIGLED